MSLFFRLRATARPLVALYVAMLVAVPLALALAAPARPAAAFGGSGHHLYLLGDSVNSVNATWAAFSVGAV